MLCWRKSPIAATRCPRRTLPQSADWVLGWINYRGRLILEIDFSGLLGDGVCPPRMSNRILVVRTSETDAEASELMGLLVESVLGSEMIEFDDSSAHARVTPPDAEFLTTVTLADSELIQLVDPLKLPKPFAEPAD
jgi:chemotaxis signal transduction protein